MLGVFAFAANALECQCSSVVEQRFRKPSVAGSIPAIGSISHVLTYVGLGRKEQPWTPKRTLHWQSRRIRRQSRKHSAKL